MRGRAKRIWMGESGASAVEFALATPFLLLIMALIFELGAALHQRNILEKSVMAGAAVAAYSSYPLDGAAMTRTRNMVRTGSPTGGANLLEGWAEAGADIQITTQVYNLSGETVPYVRVEATVPYVPMMRELFNFFGFNNFTLSAAHEEVFIL